MKLTESLQPFFRRWSGRQAGRGQQDLLPIVEGSTVNTEARGHSNRSYPLYRRRRHFHVKPSDLILSWGRFPIRVETGLTATIFTIS